MEMGRGGNNPNAGLGRVLTRSSTVRDPAVVSVRGHSWGSTHSRVVSVPSLEIENQRLYPSPFPPDDRVGPKLWKALVVEGRILNSERLRDEICPVDPETDKKDRSKRLGDAELRGLIKEAIVRQRIPYSSMIPLPSGKRGFGIARTRADIEAYIKSLRGRVSETKKVGRLKDLTHLGWDSSEFGLAWIAPKDFGWNQDKVRLVLDRLNEEKLTSSQIGELMTDSGKKPLSGDSVRDLIHDLREASVPVCARSGGANGGYWLADDKADLKKWLFSQMERGLHIQERIDALEEAAVIWFPKENETEKAEQICTKPFLFPPSREALKRAKAKEAVKAGRDEDRRLKLEAKKDLVRNQIQTYRLNGLKDAQHRIGFNLNPTAEDYLLVRKWELAKSFLKSGKLPKLKKDEDEPVWFDIVRGMN